MIRQGFDGRVEMEVTGNNMLGIVVGNGMDRDIPEHVTFVGDDRILYSNLKTFLSRTKNIRVLDPNEQDETVLSLMAFWEFASIEADYRKIWKEFLYRDSDVNNGWIEIMNASEQERLKAPPEVRPGSLSDDDLETVSPEKKRGGTTTSKR